MGSLNEANAWQERGYCSGNAISSSTNSSSTALLGSLSIFNERRMIVMPSWQFRLIKAIFQIRRLLNPPTGMLDVEKERTESEALAANFRTKLELTCTPVLA